MPDGERVTTGSEPSRTFLRRCRECGQGLIHRPEWQVPVQHGAGCSRAAVNIEMVEVQEVVEPGHDEQTEDRSETYKLYREALKDNADFAMRAELLEAELREAGDTFSEIAIYLEPDEGKTHNADACGVDACIFCLAEDRAKEARDRARGVLETKRETP